MPEVTIWLPGNPPSLNVVGSRYGNRAWAKAKKQWQTDVEWALAASSLPRNLAHVHVDAILMVPDKRRRDAGNYKALLEKVTGDALQAGAWLADDTPEFYEFGFLRFRVAPSAERRTYLRLQF